MKTLSDLTVGNITILGTQTGGNGGAGVTLKPVTLDFESIPVYSKTFQITDAAALTTSKIVINAKPDSDEYEMDGLNCSAYCAVDGTITAIIHALPGPVTGQRNFTYFLG